jgi:hypothetical protein
LVVSGSAQQAALESSKTHNSGGFKMRHALQEQEDGPVSEMAIVNTFTKLIFGDDLFTARELSIIEALQANNAGAMCENRKAVGEYLRNLGVREMIDLVSGLRQSLADCAESTMSDPRRPTPSAGVGLP